MKRASPPRHLGIALVALLAIASAAMGAAHRQPSLNAVSGLSAVMALGGNLSDICGTGHGADLRGGCDACRLVGPVPRNGPARVARAAAMERARPAFAGDVAAPQVAAPSGGARAPPHCAIA